MNSAQRHLRKIWLDRYKTTGKMAKSLSDDIIINLCLCNETTRIEKLNQEDNIKGKK